MHKLGKIIISFPQLFNRMQTAFKFAVFNGKVVPKEKAVIPIDNKAYFFDFTVYSSLKVVRGKVFFPEFHVDRLLESAKIIDLQHTFKKENILKWIGCAVSENKIENALLRIVLIGDADNNKNADLCIFPVSGLTFYPARLYSKGAKAITFPGERRFPSSKTKDLLLGFLALRKAKENNAIEALLVDREGNIREGTRSNFFAIKGTTLFTPPKEKVLDGITKKIVLEAARKDFAVKEEDIPLSKIEEYDELFISSTSLNVMPLSQIDDTKIISSFGKTKKIQKLFQTSSQ